MPAILIVIYPIFPDSSISPKTLRLRVPPPPGSALALVKSISPVKAESTIFPIKAEDFVAFATWFAQKRNSFFI